MFAAVHYSKGTIKMKAGKKKINFNDFKSTCDHTSAKSFKLLCIIRASAATFSHPRANVHFNLRGPRPSTVASAYRKPHPCTLQCHRSETVNVHSLLSATSTQLISLTKATVPRGADAVLFEVRAVDLPTRGRSLQSLII